MFSRQLDHYNCEGIPIALLSVSTPIEQLANFYDLYLQNWFEDGWGEQQGFIVELTNGWVINAENYLLSPESGVVFHCDTVIVHPDNLVQIQEICVSLFSIDPQTILWRQADLVGDHYGKILSKVSPLN